jgi:hypothetical protein
VSEPRLTPEREAGLREIARDKIAPSHTAVAGLLAEIDALRAELERTRVSLHVEAAAADAEATFANELNADVAALRARVAELEGAAEFMLGDWTNVWARDRLRAVLNARLPK